MTTINFYYNNGTTTALDTNARTISGVIKFAKDYLKEVMFQDVTARAKFAFVLDDERHEYFVRWLSVGKMLAIKKGEL